MRGWTRWLSLTLAPALACSAAPAHKGPHEVRSTDPRFEPSDPPPYTPPPSARGQTGEPVALQTRGSEEQARRLALNLVRALLEADPAALGALMAARVVRVPGGRATPREELVAQCIEAAQSLLYEADSKVDDLIDIEALAPQPVARFHEPSMLPPELREGDLAVPLPPRGGSAAHFRQIPCLRRLYIRPGPTPLLVGLGH